MLGSLFTRNLEALKRPAMATNDSEIRVIGTRSQAQTSMVEAANGKAKAVTTAQGDSPVTADDDAQDSDLSEEPEEEPEEYDSDSDDDVDK